MVELKEGASGFDLEYISERLRNSDREEFLTIFPEADLSLLLADSVSRSEAVWVATLDGEPFCVFGYGVTPDGAVPWLAGTDLLNTVPTTVLRNVKRKVDQWAETYGYMFNWVHKDNTASINMLRWLGFTVETETRPDVHPHFLFFWRKT
jgi:hypothetical protein